MATEQQIITDKERLRVWLYDRFGITASPEPHHQDMHSAGGCLDSEFASSSGPIIWAINRVRELGRMPQCGRPPDAEDFEALLISDGIVFVSPVARSKIFTTVLFPEPIDLISRKLCKFYDRHS